MKILLTNDDGIDAPGLAILAEVVSEFAEPVIVAAGGEMSECGHRVTTKRDLVLTERGENRYVLDGAPADCVRIGLTQVCPEATIVLAGVNDGANLGVDIFLSGTVAAAREAALMGREAIALSHYRRGDVPRDWKALAIPLRRVLNDYLARPVGRDAFWNINFPATDDLTPETAVVDCPLDDHPLPIEYARDGNRYRYQGVYSNRPRNPGSDIDVCFSGHIAASRVVLFEIRG